MSTTSSRSTQKDKPGARIARHAYLVVLAVLLGACATAATDSDQLQIVATTSMWGDVVANIVEDDAEISVLIPVGTDPHDFEPSSRVVAEMNGADLVVANGLGLEEGFTELLEGAESEDVEVLTLAPSLQPIPFGFDVDHSEDHEESGDHANDEDNDESEDHEDHESHDHSLDPHVWLDPVRVAEAAELIGMALEKLDDSVDWTARAESYMQKLLALDTDIRTMVVDIPPEDRLLVTNHDALGYFADRYGFTIVGTVVPGGSTLGNPSSEELANLVALMSDLGVNAIFADSTESSSLADALAEELGEDVVVVELYTGSLGEEGSGAETLISMLATDAELITAALIGEG